jgi:predicted nucleic acid-binding Zn ribbon protein
MRRCQVGIERPGGDYGAEMTAPPAWPELDETALLKNADAWENDRKTMEAKVSAFQVSRVRLFEGAAAAWSGDAADAAHAKHQTVVADLQAQERGAAAAAKLHRDTAAIVVQTKQQIIDNVEKAQQLIAKVSNDSQATDEQKSYFIQGLVKATHAENVQLVEAGAARLGNPPASPLTVRPADFTGRGVPQAPPKDAGPQIPRAGTDPNEVTRWWDSLSQEQKDQLIAQHPRDLGNLYGVPTDVRDKVNLAVMNDDINRVESAAGHNGVPANVVTQHPELYGLTPRDITRYNNAIQTRDGLNANATNRDGSRNPVFLQTYDPEAFEGRGREAIAIGNPDKADNTTVLVPGTGSSVRDGYLSHPDGQNIYNEARRADPGKTNSVLVWMGYHAPDSWHDLQIGQTTLARDGAGLLAADVNGLGATHDGASHVTVIGHSYGSTTVADAAAGFGMHANDVVLVGCPGTDLAHGAGDFHLAEGGHVYVGAASSDPISHFGGIQEHIPGTGVTVGLGDDPAVEGYGSTRFKAEVPGATFPLHDHSTYFTREGESLFSIGDIASGHGDALAHDGMTAPHRGAYWLPNNVDPETIRPGTGGHHH